MSQWDRNSGPEQEYVEKGMGEGDKKFQGLRNRTPRVFHKDTETVYKTLCKFT